MPSINCLAERYLLSRDTVEKAYVQLKENKTLSGIKGKGYFIASDYTQTQLRVCLLFNKLSPYKKVIYDNILRKLDKDTVVDLFIHHCNPDIFRHLIQKTRDLYAFYVVMPHFEQPDHQMAALLNNFPAGQLIVLDKQVNCINHKSYGSVFQDFENDLFNMLQENLERIKKYDHIYLVFPENCEYPYPQEIKRGFIKFARMNQLKFGILETIDLTSKVRGNLYIIIEDTDLVNLVKNCKVRDYTFGHDVGLICYNDSPLKEVLEDGVTVISTDFSNMGKTVGEMIRQNKFEIKQNPFLFMDRGTF